MPSPEPLTVAAAGTPSKPPSTITSTPSSAATTTKAILSASAATPRNQRYAIPYNGEEVYLHWANSDQYYVKTDEHFRNYDWRAPNGVTICLRLRNADVEQNNVKGDRRFFIPRISETAWDSDSAVITIPFEYRPLSGGEKVTYGTTSSRTRS